MKTMPRKTSRPSFIIQLALVLCFSAGFADAQPRGRNRPAKPAPATQSQAPDRARRAKALTLLAETAEEARALDDLFYRARLQALAADALYAFDRERARNIFRNAWEAAKASDKAEQEADAEEAGVATDAVEPATEARDEVLSKTARRDASLADIFLRDLLKDARKESLQDETENSRSTPWREPSVVAARRIALGLEMLAEGETESAFKIVAPVAGEGLSASLISFLLRLHERDAASGDALYRLMISAMRKDASADANTVLLLSTPIVSPELTIAFDEYGTLQFRPLPRTTSQAGPTSSFSPATLGAFFNAAAGVLLRPATVRTRANETQDKAARYFAISRLLPFFEREAAQYAPELRARALALENDFPESRRASLSSQLSLRTLSAAPSTDPLRSHFEELGRASEQRERDRITIRIVLVATQNRAWDRARRAAAELNDTEVRRAANSFIAVNQIADISRAYADEKEDDYEEIVSFLKSVDVPPLAAAWGYAQAAQIAVRRKDRQRVAELLTEAEHYAERLPPGTSQRVAAYGVIAKHAARINQQRAWELLTELVKAANALEDYAGDEVSVEIRANENSATPEAATTEDAATPFTLQTELFRLDNIFATMAHLDFERALSNARALEGRAPRVFAQLAIARAVLEKK